MEGQAFSAWLRTLYRHHWHVYSKRPFAEQALRYLGRYTHRVAISNHRLVSFVDDQVTFRWRDRAHNNQEKLLPLSLDEFLRRFLLHVLPKGFVRIRHFGFLANRRRATFLPLCSQLLGAVQPSQTEPKNSPAQEPSPSPLWLCPKCGGNGDHRATYRGPAPTPLSTLSRRSSRMKLQLQPPSLGASRHLPVWCALLTPNHLSLSNLGSNCHSSPMPTTRKTILRSLFSCSSTCPRSSTTIQFA